MRVLWPAIEDETPPDGAEVVMVRGYMSHEITRFVLRDGKVDAGSVAAERSWFYNRKDGESFQAYSFDVDAGRFVVAWNAMRRILGASDERIEPEPEGHPDELHFLSGSHESADWIRARAAAEVHCADRPSASFDWDGVRLWDGLRDRAIFELFRALIPEDARRAASLASWADFAAAEVRAAAKALDVDRDHELVETCVRILGVAGATGAADDVAALDATLPDLDDYRVRSLREETTRAATRLRVRHHWDRDDVVRTLRAIPPGRWANEDQGRWLREVFREKDPEGWAAFCWKKRRARARVPTTSQSRPCT